MRRRLIIITSESVNSGNSLCVVKWIFHLASISSPDEPMTPNKSRDTFSPYRITMFHIENLCSNSSISRWTSPTASSSIQPKDFMPRLCPTGHILRPQRPPARPFQVGRYECVFPSPSFLITQLLVRLLCVSFSLPPLLATGASSSVNGMCVTGSQIDIVSSPDGQATHKVQTYAAAI